MSDSQFDDARDERELRDESELRAEADEAGAAPAGGTAPAGSADYSDTAPAGSGQAASAANPTDAEGAANSGDAGSSAKPGNAADPAVPAADQVDDGIDMSAFEEQLEDSDLAKALARNAELEDQLARANASLYNLDQEYAGYVRRSKEAAGATRDSGKSDVLEAIIPVLDDIYAARQAGDLADGPFAAIASKLEETLASRFGLERYGEVGDEFDPQLHEALMANVSPDVEVPTVAQVLQPGYRRGDRVLRPVKVLVNNPQ